MGTIRFEIRKEKADKTGKAPIRLIYQISGQRKYFNTDFKVFEYNWNAKAQTFVYLDKKQAKKLLPLVDYDLFPTDKEVKRFNSDLVDLERTVRDIEKRFELDKIPYSAEMVIERLKEENGPKTKKLSPSKYLFDFIDQYIRDHEATRVKGSLSVYKSLKTHLQDLQRIKKVNVSFENIDASFFQKFESFLISGEGRTFDKTGKLKQREPLNNITAAKQSSTIKTFLNYARDQKIPVPEVRYKIKRETDLEVIALTNDELERLFTMDLSDKPSLDQVRDVFCFSCFTGLRYSDLKQLRREHINNDTIEITTIKTTDKASIPLTPYSRAILDKYKDMHRPLPVISNQKSNKQLEKLCKLAEINTQMEIVRKYGGKRDVKLYPKYELVRMHCGRKTFVTLSLERKIPAEVVMSLSGHKDHRSFSRYVKVTEERKKAAMLAAWGSKTVENNLKAV